MDKPNPRAHPMLNTAQEKWLACTLDSSQQPAIGLVTCSFNMTEKVLWLMSNCLHGIAFDLYKLNH